MIEIVKAIALICQLNVGTSTWNVDEVEKRQRACQVHLAKCMVGHSLNKEEWLVECVASR